MSIPVGELVILQNSDYFTEYDGQLGVIVGALHWRRVLDLRTMTRERRLRYSVRPLVPGGIVVASGEHQVRRLRDPGEECTSERSNGLLDEVLECVFVDRPENQ